MSGWGSVSLPRPTWSPGAPAGTGRTRPRTARPARGWTCADDRSRCGPGRAAGVELGRDVDTLAPERRRDPGPQLTAHLELPARQRPRHHAHRERVDLDRLHAHHGGRVEQDLAQLAVVVGLLPDLAQD